MFQIANSFDPITIGKIKRSARIAFGGFLIAFIPLMMKEITESIAYGDAIDLRTSLAAGVAAFGTWIYNAVQEWLAGMQQV